MNTFNKQLCHFSFLLLSILSILSAWVAHAQEQIIWQLNHAPPSTIVHGEFKNKGFIDLILKDIIDQLPQYEHVIEVSTLASSSFEIRAKKMFVYQLYLILLNDKNLWFFPMPVSLIQVTELFY